MGYYTSVSMTLSFYDVPAGAPGKGAGSGTYYAGGGWGFSEHQDEFALIDDTSKPSRSFSCHEVRTK